MYPHHIWEKNTKQKTLNRWRWNAYTWSLWASLLCCRQGEPQCNLWDLFLCVTCLHKAIPPNSPWSFPIKINKIHTWLFIEHSAFLNLRDNKTWFYNITQAEFYRVVMVCFNVFIYFWSPLKQEQFSSNSLIHDQIIWLSISTVVKWHLMMLNGKKKKTQQ